MTGRMKKIWFSIAVFCMLFLCSGDHQEKIEEAGVTIVYERNTDLSNLSIRETSVSTEIENSIEANMTEKETQTETVECSTVVAEESISEQSTEATVELQLEQYLSQMTTEEKVAQLFIILPEVFSSSGNVTAVDEAMRQHIAEIPVGGFIFMEPNLVSTEQTEHLLADIQKAMAERTGLPALLCVDEEGGGVARIAGNANFGVANVGNMSDIGATMNPQNAYEAGATIGQYLSQLGFNVDFAPVADVWSNPANQVVQYRSFGADASLVSDMCAAFTRGLQERNVYAVWKHFPGHGATEADTHQGYAYINKTLQELQLCELLPFQRGIRERISFIMAGHISVPEVTGDQMPASLSGVMLSQILRAQMGYEGVIVTDAMNMGAVVQNFNSRDAAVQAVLAGADIILMPADFYSAYQGVLDAVQNGQITVERLDESVRRIVMKKLEIKQGEMIDAGKYTEDYYGTRMLESVDCGEYE